MIGLLLAASFAIAGPVAGQIVPVPLSGQSEPSTAPKNEVEGNTPGRVQQIEQCQGRKFDTRVEIDPLTKRSTRVKLCANPGSTDADWVKTLESAIVQIEQRDMPVAAKNKVIAELRQEITNVAAATRSASANRGAMLDLDGEARARSALTVPAERFETSIVPPLPDPLPRRIASADLASSSAGVAPRTPPIRFRVKCLAPGETGGGSACDFVVSNTVLVLSAEEGLDKGGRLVFRRRGEARGEVGIAPLSNGKLARVRIPRELCRGVANTRFDLEMLPPGSGNAVAGRAGPYDIRC